MRGCNAKLHLLPNLELSRYTPGVIFYDSIKLLKMIKQEKDRGHFSFMESRSANKGSQGWGRG